MPTTIRKTPQKWNRIKLKEKLKVHKIEIYTTEERLETSNRKILRAVEKTTWFDRM